MLQFWGKEQTHFKNKTNKKKTPATSGPVLSFLLPLQLENTCLSEQQSRWPYISHKHSYKQVHSFVLLHHYPSELLFFFFRKLFITPLDEVIFYIMYFPDLYNCLSQLSIVIILISDSWM